MKTEIRYPFERFHIHLTSIIATLFLFGFQQANSQTYTTAGTYTYTVPAGVTSVTILTWGAGGGSGGVFGNTTNQAAGGGGGGAFTQNTFTVTAGRVLTVKVGAGGIAGTTAGTDGGNGGTSSVTGTAVSITAAGGTGGGGVTTAGGSGTAGTGATTGSGYSIIYAGGDGAAGARSGTREVGGGGGGGAGSGSAGSDATIGTTGFGGFNSAGGSGGTGTYPGGDGADGVVSTGNVAGVAGNTPGGGAAGAANGNNTGIAGAAGSDGQVIILTPCSAPTVPTGFAAGTQTSTTAPGSFTAPGGGATGYLVFYSTSATAPTPAPVTGTTYTSGTTYLIGGINYTAATVTGTSFTNSGLTSNTKYYFYIYSYNNTSCVGPVYSTTKLTGNITTCAGAPTMSTATSITSSGFTANWTAPTGGAAGSITYTIDVSLTTTFGAGNDISGYPVSGITGLSNVVSGLSSNTKYYYQVTATNGICATTSANTNTTTSLPACTTPSVPTSFVAGTQTSTTAPGSFTAPGGGASGYLVFYSTSATAPSPAPVTGTTYTSGTTYSIGGINYTAATVTGTSFTNSGLTSNTKYYFFIYSYNTTSCTGGPLYSTTYLSGNITTCAGAPTMGAATSITSSGFTANWTAPTGGAAGSITYTIDVSLTTTFGAGNDISGYPVSGITGLSNVVSGLSSNTKYYYQVTATNGICATTSSITNTTTSLAACTTPSAPTGLSLTPSVVSIAGSFTAPGTAPTGYLVIRTTSSTAPTTPVTGTTYTAGSSALGGYIVSNGTTTSFTDMGLSAATQYWYWVYSYNSTTCSGGPLYSTTNLNGNAITASVCGSFSVYALDDQGYIYPLNTSTGALQTPLNNSVGPNSGTATPNALGYNPNNSKFYFLSSTSTGGFSSYDGVSTYASLASPFSSGTYPVVGTATVTANGYYAIAWQTGALYYYSIASNTWTTVATTIKDGSGNNLSTQIVSSENNGDLVEDGYGTLWILMSSGSNFGLYYILAPPTTAVTTVTAYQAINYSTALPGSAGGTAFNGAAFDAGGNLFLSNLTSLFEIPVGSTTASLVGTFSGLNSGSSNIRDLAQCSYTSNPLPLTWTYFNASPQNNEVNIDWGIAQASSVKGFYVERSNDSKNWDTLGFAQYVNGDLNYTYKDASPMQGTNYYRINEVDFDEQSNYSIIRTVEFSNPTVVSVWPNPAVNVVHIQYSSNAANVNMQIFDELGRNVTRSSIYQGDNIIDISNLSKGVYFLILQEENKQIFYKKFIKN